MTERPTTGRGRLARRLAVVLAVAVTATAVVVAQPARTPDVASAATLTTPAGFTNVPVATVPSPVALAFAGDDLLVATQPGKLRVIQGGSLRAAPVIDLAQVRRLCTNSERGLLGVAVDRSFATNRFVYLYYTFDKFGGCATKTATTPVNRLSRFTVGADLTIAATSEQVLIDDIPSFGGIHQGGDVHMAADGLLYVSVGDSGCDLRNANNCHAQNGNARRTDILAGKILRVAPDGSIPASNPFAGTAGARRCGDGSGAGTGAPCLEIFATGLRNPFRIAFRPGTSEFFINDVGQFTWEEIDRGQAGADYGWNLREGPCPTGQKTGCSPSAGFVDPVFAYVHTSDRSAITGGAFVPAGAWPAPHGGSYLFADYSAGDISRLVEGSPPSRASFATGLGSSSATSLLWGPSPVGQSLYYTSYANGGSVSRIDHVGTSGGNRPPSASFSADVLEGPAPLAVSFDAGTSTDPDPGDSLVYRWTFGDGTSAELTSPTTTHTYAAAGTYTASLTVTDRQGATSSRTSVTITATGNRPPTATIDSPTAGTRFGVGDVLRLRATASDPEDGPLPASALSWTVVRHHDTHTHPFLGPVTGNDIALPPAPEPEDLPATKTSWLEVVLTATDSSGAATTVRRRVDPATVTLTFKTDPKGLAVHVFGQPMPDGTKLTAWRGWVIPLSAPDQAKGSKRYRFKSWSDKGAQTHDVVTPAKNTKYTAKFAKA